MVSTRVIEQIESRRVQTGKNCWAELRYCVIGTTTEFDARAAVSEVIPATYDLHDGSGPMPLANMRADPIPQTENAWDVVVLFSKLYGTFDLPIVSFDTTGGTEHIEYSLATRGSYAPPGKTPTDHGGAIGVTPEGVEGVDVDMAGIKFHEAYRFPPGSISYDYIKTLAGLSRKVNAASFRVFDAGELKFNGAVANRDANGWWTITYEFEVSPNAIYDPMVPGSGLSVGDITGISKRGWDYLWIEWEEKELTGGGWSDPQKVIAKRPRAVYVEQVKQYVDFGLLGI